jgi:hypothetical protein
VRRTAPLWLVVVGVIALLTWYVFYMRSVVTDLRAEASRVGKMYARVYDALNDPNPDAPTTALQDLSALMRESGVPIIVTDYRIRESAGEHSGEQRTHSTVCARAGEPEQARGRARNWYRIFRQHAPRRRAADRPRTAGASYCDVHRRRDLRPSN